MTNSPTQLGCGRDIDDVWDNIDRPPTPHEENCSFCRAARTDLTELAAATRRLREDDTTTPDLQPEPTVVSRILTIARSEVRRGRRLPLNPPGADGTSATTVSEQAVATVIRRIADLTPEIQIRRCAVTTHPATAEPGIQPAQLPVDRSADVLAIQPVPVDVAVSLRVSVVPHLPIPAAASRLRTTITRAVATEVGLNVTTIDITVEDLHHD